MGNFALRTGRALIEVLPLFQTDDLPSGAAQDFSEIKTALIRKGKAIGTL